MLFHLVLPVETAYQGLQQLAYCYARLGFTRHSIHVSVLTHRKSYKRCSNRGMS